MHVSHTPPQVSKVADVLAGMYLRLPPAARCDVLRATRLPALQLALLEAVLLSYDPAMVAPTARFLAAKVCPACVQLFFEFASMLTFVLPSPCRGKSSHAATCTLPRRAACLRREKCSAR